MSFRRNLARARSHIILVLGLIAASAIIMSLELSDLPGDDASDYRWRVARPLTVPEEEAAAYAWHVIQSDPAAADRHRATAEALGIAQTPPPAQMTSQSAEIVLDSIAKRTARAVKE